MTRKTKSTKRKPQDITHAIRARLAAGYDDAQIDGMIDKLEQHTDVFDVDAHAGLTIGGVVDLAIHELGKIDQRDRMISGLREHVESALRQYIGEAEHGDGIEYWTEHFQTSEEALKDFILYTSVALGMETETHDELRSEMIAAHRENDGWNRREPDFDSQVMPTNTDAKRFNHIISMYWIYAEDMVGVLVGPFENLADAFNHIQFCVKRGDGASHWIMDEREHDAIIRSFNPDIITPTEDRAHTPQKDLTHPFVAGPKSKKCTSCGKTRNHRIHDMD